MKLEALAMWTMMVRQHGPWDHKDIIKVKHRAFTTHRPTKGQVWAESYYHKYKRHDYFYDVWSNIHYGYVGMACGFTEKELLNGAGLEQTGSDILARNDIEANPNVEGLAAYDNIADRETIRLGCTLFKQFGVDNVNKLTEDKVLQGLENISNLGDSRVIHYCFDTSTDRFTED